MAGVRAVRMASTSESPRSLYERIGNFLFDQRLDPDPANYAFAHHLLANPDSPLARAVHALTDGGVRLTQRDIESLGCEMRPVSATEKAEKADGLVARTQIQVEGFADMVTAIRAETADFGRNLAASAEAISRSATLDGTGAGLIDEVARITGTMLERVHSAESRLESATREASELRQKLEEARDNARRDPLTDLPNRRAFEEAFAAQAASGAPLCVAVCDVDHFKSVNDRFGHAVGDRVLKAIGESLTQSCPGHLVARYGGEEFAILFSGVALEKARVTLDGARARVAVKRYRLRETDVSLGEISFSAGLTAAPAGEAYSAVFQRADRLLYAAKTAGRNRLHVG
jgi:diguanylate cyclase